LYGSIADQPFRTCAGRPIDDPLKGFACKSKREMMIFVFIDSVAQLNARLHGYELLIPQ
jgi:hypothetical protein